MNHPTHASLATSNGRELIERMGKAHVFVVGDLILDSYIEGKVQRISPEAPVPVVLESRQRAVIGGAGNVAANVSAFGAKAYLCGRIGKDVEGEKFRQICHELGIQCHFIESAALPTTRKTRVMAGYQQLLRIDHESTETITRKDADEVRSALDKFCQIKGSKSCVISDYAKGVLPSFLIREIIDLCKKHNIPVVTDPKSPDLARYAGSTVLKPDLKEGQQALKRAHPAAIFSDFESEVQAIGASVIELSQAENIALSLSEKGLIVMGKQLAEPARLPTRALKVADVSGAGDTMVAFLSLGLASGIDLRTSAEISNIAAGIVCGKLGTATLTRDELLTAVTGQSQNRIASKVISRDELVRRAAELRNSGKKIVFTNGCFDILHSGHVDYLNRAKELGDVLVLGLNSDASVKRLKGPTRPIQSAEHRAFVLAGLSAIDLIVEFEEDTPLELILACRPDVLVKGGDWKAEEIIGGKEVRSWGGRVDSLSFVDGQSTTNLIKKAQLGPVKLD